jgi:hypothetical protein
MVRAIRVAHQRPPHRVREAYRRPSHILPKSIFWEEKSFAAPVRGSAAIWLMTMEHRTVGDRSEPPRA